MEKNLSSRIVLHQVPRKYYQPGVFWSYQELVDLKKSKLKFLTLQLLAVKKLLVKLQI